MQRFYIEDMTLLNSLDSVSVNSRRRSSVTIVSKRVYTNMEVEDDVNASVTKDFIRSTSLTT